MTAFSPRFTITNAITAGLTAVERARGFLEAVTLSDKWVRRMSQRALLLEAHHTTHIEGTQLTIDQAERLWAGKKVDEAQPDDVRELLNYRQAFNLVSEYLESGEVAIRTDVVAREHRLNPRQTGGARSLARPRQDDLRRAVKQFSRGQPPHSATGSQSDARQRTASGGGNRTDRSQPPLCHWGAVTSCDMEL
jgi:Fic family protein